MRLWKLILFGVIIYFSWKFLVHSSPPPAPEVGSVEVVPRGIFEETAASDVLSILGASLSLQHRFIRVEGNKEIHWLYYSFAEFDPNNLSAGLKSKGYAILSVVTGKNGMVQAEKSVNGISMVVSVFSDPEKNALVITVTVPVNSEDGGSSGVNTEEQ